MNDRLVVFLIEREQITVSPLRGLSRADPSLVKDYLYLAYVRTPGPRLENAFSNVHQEINSPAHYKVDVVGVITPLVNVLAILYF